MPQIQGVKGEPAFQFLKYRNHSCFLLLLGLLGSDQAIL